VFLHRIRDNRQPRIILLSHPCSVPGESTWQILADVGRVVGKDAKTAHRNVRLFIETDRPHGIFSLRCVRSEQTKAGSQSA
jgi:hypothetical protein